MLILAVLDEKIDASLSTLVSICKQSQPVSLASHKDWKQGVQVAWRLVSTVRLPGNQQRFQDVISPSQEITP